MSGFDAFMTNAQHLMDLVQTIGIIVLGLYSFALRKATVNKAAIDRVDEHVEELVRRVDRLEARVDGAPDHDDIGNLHDRITELSGALRELVGVMSAVQRSLDRVETKLINDGGKP